MNDMDLFIANEINYFEPMQTRQQHSSDKERIAWRIETVRERQERISREVFDLFGGVVAYGPFKGLKLNEHPWWGSSDLGSQCLGLYELELLNIINHIKFDEYSVFIDVGAADGYYAIGMLTTGKIKHCICFEQSTIGQDTIKRNWLLNGRIGKLEILGEATPSNILHLTVDTNKKMLMLVDIEGDEFELLTLPTLRHLRNCTILIEIHNWVDDFKMKYSHFLKCASNFFNISIIPRVDRSTSSFEELRDFTDDNRALLTSERRPCLMRFLQLTPK